MLAPSGVFGLIINILGRKTCVGIPLIEGGKIIGAVGCSGATGDQDAVACKAGVDTVK